MKIFVIYFFKHFALRILKMPSSLSNSKYDHEPSILNKLEVGPQLNALEECFKSYILCRYKKTHVLIFSFFISSIFEFYFMNALDIAFVRKNSKILEMKNKKN